MKKTITIVTSTRADYGLLRPVIKKLTETTDFSVKLVVTGTHLSNEFGNTYKEIIADNILIDRKIETLLSSDSSTAVSKSMGIAIIGFADYFEAERPDALLVLGDRYEILAVVIAAMNENIPVIHLHGGEATEGLTDEACRHAITKMSCLHFTATEQYRKRVIQLGEAPDRVFNVGALGVENALTLPLLSKAELEAAIGFKLDKPYACVTFHPVTLEHNTSEPQTKELLAAMNEFPHMRFIFTKANADANGRIINRLIDEYTAQHDNAIAFASLGVKKYLSAVKYAAMVIGNSSSGLIEAPSFHIPTINIGDRQKGRTKAESVIDCPPNENAIANAIQKALSPEFKAIAERTENPYGSGRSSASIVKEISAALENGIDLKKKFFDISFEVAK